MTTPSHEAAALLRAGIDRAASAMCAMLNSDVEVGDIVEHVDLPRALDALAVRIDVEGDIQGSVLLVVPGPHALQPLLDVPEDLLDSAVEELANVVDSHLIVGIASTGRSLTIAPPMSTHDTNVLEEWIAMEDDEAWIELRVPVTVHLGLLVHPED